MLADHAEIVMGQSPKAADVNEVGDGLPLLNGPTEFGPTNPLPVQFTTKASKHCQEGDLLFCVRGSTTGRMNWADQPYAIGRGIAAIRHKRGERLQPLLRAVIEHELDALLVQATGSTFPNVSSAMLARIDWPRLSEKDEDNASDLVGLLDDKVELLRRINVTLEETGHTLFRAWFVDFLPVRAKAAGATSFRGVTQKLFDSLPDSFEPSEMGEIPKGWMTKPLDEVAGFLNGLALQKYRPAGSDEGLPVIKIAELRKGISEKTERAAKSIPEKYKIHDGDLIFSWSGSLIAKFWTDGDGALNQHLFKVTGDGLPLSLVAHWIWHHLERFQRIAEAKATTMGHIKRGHLSEALVLLPPEDLLPEFAVAIDQLIEKQIANSLEQRTLAALRRTLLPKLISGELEAPSVEASAS